jgi:serine/threonine-protein kinase
MAVRPLHPNNRATADRRRRALALTVSVADASSDPGADALCLRSGERVADHLELRRELGRGAMGVVWAARHELLGIEVAVKFLDGVAMHAEARARFRVEAMVLAQISAQSSDIVRVLDAGEHRGVPFFVMELVAGSSLDELLDDGPLDLVEAGRLISRLATAVDLVHAAGFVHRDIKPGNVLVSADRRIVKLADFGVVKVMDAAALGVRATRNGSVLGSPAYLAPEQLGGSACSPAQDHWALAVTAYELVADRLPFDGPSLTALAVAITKIRFRSLASLGLPHALDAVFHRAFAPEVAARFPTARAFADALASAIELSTTSQTPSIAPSPEHQDTAADQAGLDSLLSQSLRPSESSIGRTSTTRASARASFVGPALLALLALLLVALFTGGRQSARSPASAAVGAPTTADPLEVAAAASDPTASGRELRAPARAPTESGAGASDALAPRTVVASSSPRAAAPPSAALSVPTPPPLPPPSARVRLPKSEVY